MQLHINVGYDNISSKFDFQGLGLKAKVTAAIFRKKKTTKKLCHRSSAYIYLWILIQLHTNVWYNNILSKFDFQGAGLNVKVTVAIFLNLCYGSPAYIY